MESIQTGLLSTFFVPVEKDRNRDSATHFKVQGCTMFWDYLSMIRSVNSLFYLWSAIRF